MHILKLQVMGKCESMAGAEKENCMSEVFATFLFLMCCLKLKGGRDVRTGRESIVIENYGSSGISGKKNNAEDAVRIRVGISLTAGRETLLQACLEL